MPSSTLFPERIRHEISSEQVDALLLWCADRRASDIVFLPGDPVWMQIDGQWFTCTDTPVTATETQIIVANTTRQPGRAGYILGGHSADYSYAIRVPGSRTRIRRFRANATSTTRGISLTFRSLPETLPCLGDIEGLEEEIRKALFPSSGLIIVSGVMGSGKSTLLAAVMHEALLGHTGPSGLCRQVLTLEDPVEFSLDIPWQERHAPTAQSAIHLDVSDWASGVRSMTRRKGEIVMVGECRDMETADSLLSITEQGVTAYTTVHAPDVPQTLNRIIDIFPEPRRDAAAAILCSNIRLIVHQRLVPRLRTEEEIRAGVPGRVALREFLVFDGKCRATLSRTSRSSLGTTVHALVAARGQTLLSAAMRLREHNAISQHILQEIQQEQACL